MCSKLNRTGFTKKLLGVITVAMMSSTAVYASQLPSKSNLSINQGTNGFVEPLPGTGSWFAMEALGPGGWVYTGIGGNEGLLLGGTAQFSRAENVAPELTEVSSVDNSWSFFGSLGLHGHTGVVISDNATVDTADLDFTGWYVSWNTSAVISMGGDPDNFLEDTGIATVTCAADCTVGDTYTLVYAGHVPLASADFPGVSYQLHLEGTIADTNLAPIAISDLLIAAVVPLNSVRIDLPANVIDPDGDGVDNGSFDVIYTGSRAATLELCTAAAAPNALCQAEGDVIYTDNDGSDTVTADTFTYTVADILGKVSEAFTVEVSVVSGNIPPIAQSFSVDTDKDVAAVVDVIANVTDSDGTVDPTTVAWSNAVNGTVTNVDASGFVTFTPFASFTGIASFNYTVNDDTGDTSNIATVTVNVNDPPFAGDTIVAVDRNSFVIVDVVALTTDSDGTVNPASVMATADANGSTSVDIGTGMVTYTPTFGVVFLGAAQFTYTIDDDKGATSNPGTVNVNIVNALPVAVDDISSIDTSANTSVDIDVTVNDTDSDGTINNTTVDITTDPTGGNATVSGTGVITYTPNAGFVGADTLQYTVNDNDSGTSNAATVAISVSSGSDFCQIEPLTPDSCFLVFNPGKVSGDVAPVALGNGSYFSMETQPGVPLVTPIVPFNNLQINTSQPASSVPLVQDIDQGWNFFGNIGVHQSTSVVTVASDDAAGNVTFDFRGWDVSWNGIASIPLGEGQDNGLATMTCYSDDLFTQTPGDCSAGDTFVLDYHATVPEGDPSGFGDVKYRLHMEGRISETGTVYTSSGTPNTTTIEAFDANGDPASVEPGDAAIAAGNTTGINLTAADIGVTDPLLNPTDGQQCLGGCVDFVVTAGTDYVDIIYRLSTPIVDGAIYRKLINGVWDNFDTSGQDLLGSNGDGSSVCDNNEFPPGLRAGNLCVFMRIFDGGPNDADGIKNGKVVDPSGVLVAGSPNVPAGSSDGCSISSTKVDLTERADWLIVAGFIAWLGLIGYRRKKAVS